MVFTIFSITLVALGSKRFASISNLGMIASTSPLYFVGIAILILAIVLGLCNNHVSPSLSIIQVLLLEGFLWYVPAQIFPSLPFPGSNHDFYFYSNWFGLLKAGHLQPQVLSYQAYPGAYLLISEIITIVGFSNAVTLFQLTPFILNVAVTLFLLVGFRAIIGKDQSRVVILAILIFQLFNFTGVLAVYTFFSVGYVFFYLGLSLAAAFGVFSSRARRLGNKELLLLFLLFAAVSITHPEIPLVLLGVLIFPLTFKAILTKNTNEVLQVLRMGIVLASVIIGWVFIGGYAFLHGFGPGIVTAFLNPLGTFLGAGTVQLLNSAAGGHLITNYLKIATTLLVAFVALPMVIEGIMKRSVPVMSLVLGLLGIAFTAVLVGNIQGFGYVPRVFSYSLPILAVFAGVTLSRARRLTTIIILVFLTISVPIFFATNYSDLAVDNIPPSVIDASVYFAGHAPLASQTNHANIYELQIIGFYGYNLNTIYPYYSIIFPNNNPQLNSPSNLFSAKSLQGISYFVLGSNTAQQVGFFYGNSSRIREATVLSTSNSSYNLVYSGNTTLLFSLRT